VTMIEEVSIHSNFHILLQREELHCLLHTFLSSTQSELFGQRLSTLDLIYQLLQSESGCRYIQNYSLVRFDIDMIAI
jgi:hypothetical protein